MPQDNALRDDWETDSSNQVRIKLHKFFADQSQLEPTAKDKSNPQTSADQRVSNVHVGHALDNAMMHGIGIQMREFETKTKLEPTKANEMRYLAHVDSHISGSRLRSCILNEITGETRLEYPVDTVGGVDRQKRRCTSALTAGWSGFPWQRRWNSASISWCS